MEREKMIEEIARKVCIACGKCKELKADCYLARNIASVMIDDGYRKVPEGAVILTKEEYADLKTYSDCAVCEHKEIEQASKETAREILQEVKAFLDTQTKTVDSLSNSKSRYAIPESCNECYKGSQENRIAEIKRIAEKYGVEVEE